MQDRLIRSRSDRVVAGVCGGLASYFNVDSTIVRLVFVVAVLSGVSPLLYIILWIIMPEEANVLANPPAAPQLSTQQPATPTTTPQQDPTGEWKYDPYTGQPIKTEH